MEEKLWCVYIHTNKINGKKYVGMTCNIDARFGKDGGGYLHKKKNGEYVQPYFARAILKYGWDNFDHEIVKDNLTLEEANELEEETIIKYNTQNIEKGYNIRNGGSHGQLKEETIEKLSETMSGRYDGENNPFYGKTHNDETKNKIRETAKKTASKYTKKELSERMRKVSIGNYYECIETGKIYSSTREAAEELGIHRSCISNAVNGTKKTAGGFHWRKIPKQSRTQKIKEVSKNYRAKSKKSEKRQHRAN